MDVNVLMDQAETQHHSDASATKAMNEAAEIAVVKPIIQSVEAGLFPEPVPSSRTASPTFMDGEEEKKDVAEAEYQFPRDSNSSRPSRKSNISMNHSPARIPVKGMYSL